MEAVRQAREMTKKKKEDEDLMKYNRKMAFIK